MKIRNRAARWVLTVAVGFLMLALAGVLALAPVHHALHHDGASHPCALCALAKSQLDPAPTCNCVAPPAPSVLCVVESESVFVPSTPAYLLPPGRAPPVSLVAS